MAIVGTGGIAGQHVNAVRHNAGRAQLVAAVDLDPARLARFRDEHGIAGYADLDEMLEKERPDVVAIATPPSSHASLSIRCLEGGAWVLCEKPLCGSLAELDQIAAAEARTGNHCASVFQWRFGSTGQHLRGMIERGDLGRHLVGICQTTWFRAQRYYEVPWRGRWDSELGGATMGHGIHAMDLFLWLLGGDWSEVSAMLGTLDREMEVEDVSVAIVRFAGGALATVVNSVLSPHEETYVRLDFQRASVEVRALYHYTNSHWTFTPAPGADVAWQVPTDEGSSHGAQLRALLDSMDRGVAPPAGTADVRPTFEFLSSLYRSAAEGRPVRRGEIGPGDPFYAHVGGTFAGVA